MLTKAEHELLTRVGPGTPAGELLRRYWHPGRVDRRSSPTSQPTKFVRLLGEDLVLFKDKSGNVGLDPGPLRPPRRLAAVRPGRRARDLLRLPRLAVRHQGRLPGVPGRAGGQQVPPHRQGAAYPVQTFIGLYWAYLGPLPAPAIPNYDVWVRKDGHRKIDRSAPARLQLAAGDGELGGLRPPADPPPGRHAGAGSTPAARRAASSTRSPSSTSTSSPYGIMKTPPLQQRQRRTSIRSSSRTSCARRPARTSACPWTTRTRSSLRHLLPRSRHREMDQDDPAR